MRKLLFQSFFRGPLTEPAPALDEAAVEELAAALQARRAATPRQKPLDPRNRCRVMQRVRAGDPCAEQRLLRRRAFRYPVRRLAAPRRRSHGHGAGDQKHARCAGANLSCDPRPEMGRCPGRLRTGWRMFCRQLRGGRRGLASRSRRSSYSRLPAAARYDFAGTSRPARSNGQNRRFDLRLWRPLRLFQAGLVAGCVQAGLVSVMTPLVIVFAQYRDHDPGASGATRRSR